MMDWIAGIVIILGGVFAVIAAVGLLRLPDLLIRMHASTKVGTLASGLILLGVALTLGDASVVVRCLAIFIFLLLTAPIAGHMIGRAALRSGVRLWRTEARADTSGDG
ncbi:MAG: monovalent cation/H(+) antiporter subunit G [Pseudomonadota bacterium]